MNEYTKMETLPSDCFYHQSKYCSSQEQQESILGMALSLPSTQLADEHGTLFGDVAAAGVADAYLPNDAVDLTNIADYPASDGAGEDHSMAISTSKEPIDPVVTSDDDEVASEDSILSNSITATRYKKRNRDDDEDQDAMTPSFREFQTGQWAQRFQDLAKYHQKHATSGSIPHRYPDEPLLARWCKRQRYQYKLMMNGGRSTMTKERASALANIGFVWDSQNVSWLARLDELKQFKDVHGHCHVPSTAGPLEVLHTWLKCQRRQYRLFCQGKPSHITTERIAKLEAVGFRWDAARGAKKRKRTKK